LVGKINKPSRFITLLSLGNTHFKAGIWVGVELNEPIGKNDGSVGGKRYFSCTSRYGLFVRPSAVFFLLNSKIYKMSLQNFIDLLAGDLAD